MRLSATQGRQDARNGLICAGLVLVTIALTFPSAESGVNDDWSYTKTALDLAQTGELRYNGWAAAMQGAQAYWGAAFIKLFGFSFLATRLSTAPLAAGCAVLLYALHRRAQLPPTLSVFGALVITTSPLFIPHAASFMTDVPAFFLFLSSLYGYTRLSEMLDDASPNDGYPAPRRLELFGWLLVATVSGLLAGTVRQVFWVLPVLAPLYLVVRSPTKLKHAVWAALLLSSSLALAVAVWLAVWFHAQPYAIHERVLGGITSLFDRQTPLHLAQQLSGIVLTLGALTLPMLLAWPVIYGKILTRHVPGIVFGGACGLLAALFTMAELRLVRTGWTFPWMQTTVAVTPYMSGTTAMPASAIPVIFPWKFWKGFSILTICLTNLSASIAIVTCLWRGWTKAPPIDVLPRNSAPVALFALFAAAYLPLVMVKSLSLWGGGLSDRYLLPLLPLATLTGLGIYYRAKRSDRVPGLAWLALLLMAFYGVAQTHDYFSLLRARLKLTNALEARGIPRTRILGGFEYEGWTQLTLGGHYSDPRIDFPKDASPPAAPLPFDTVYSLWRGAPVVRPDYFVCLFEHPDLLNTDLPSVTYSAWLPSFQRRCLVQVKDPSLVSVRSLPFIQGR